MPAYPPLTSGDVPFLPIVISPAVPDADPNSIFPSLTDVSVMVGSTFLILTVAFRSCASVTPLFASAFNITSISQVQHRTAIFW